jgi:hypothetical protein
MRRICSYDMAAVPEDGYTLLDAGGEFYLCGARCLAIWALQAATKDASAQTDGDVPPSFELITPAGEKRTFGSLLDLARWSTANALGPTDAEWLARGEKCL